jgi:hypothetical protein
MSANLISEGHSCANSARDAKRVYLLFADYFVSILRLLYLFEREKNNEKKMSIPILNRANVGQCASAVRVC